MISVIVALSGLSYTVLQLPCGNDAVLLLEYLHGLYRSTPKILLTSISKQ